MHVRVTQTLSELPQSVVTTSRINNFKGQLDEDEVEKIIFEFLLLVFRSFKFFFPFVNCSQRLFYAWIL